MSHRSLRRLPATIITLILLASCPPVLTAAAKPDYDREVKRIQQYIAKGDLDHAGKLVNSLLAAYPGNPELLAMQARLHFWAGRHEESLAIYRRLLVKHPTQELRQEMEKVETARDFALVGRCRAAGKFVEMEELLLGLYRSRAGKYDAGLQLARFYQETKRWGEARDLLAAMVKTYPADQGLVELYVSSRVALVPPAPVVAPVRETSAEPVILPVPEPTPPPSPPDPFVAYLARPNSVLLKVSYAANTKGYSASTDTTLELAQKLGGWTVAPRFMVSRRFHLTNIEAGVDVYPPALKEQQLWGYLSLTTSPGADFLPRWTVGAAVYKGTGWGEFSIGYRRMSFTDSTVDIFSPGHSLSLMGNLTLENRLYVAINRSTISTAFSPGLTWEPDLRTKAFVRLTMGQEAEETGPSQALEQLTIFEVRAGAEYRFTPAVGLLGELFVIDRERIYDSTGIVLGIRYWW